MEGLRRVDSQRGSLMVIVALALAVLLGAGGLSVDVGRLYAERSRLQTVADAAALAGAQELPESPAGAEQAAYDNIAANETSTAGASVSVSTDQRRIHVGVGDDVDMTLARVLGLETAAVRAKATAGVAVPGAVRGAQPLGVEVAQFVLGQAYTMKMGASDSEVRGYRGNFHALALGATGADEYEYNLRHGYEGWLHADQEVPTEPGNMQGPTMDALSDRMDADPYSTWDHVRATSPRLLLVPLIEEFDDPGRSEVLTKGFAIFFLERVRQSGEVRGRFIEYHVPGRPADPGTVSEYGTRVVYLID